jgi:cell division protein ZapA
MSDLIPINLVIGDRTYRVRINADDEEKVRKLIKVINDRVLEFKYKFAGKDMQDYIAMVLLWFVTEQQEGMVSADLEKLSAGLSNLESLLDGRDQQRGV